jgi:propanol-preferring alcohol dehydrogenase
MTNSWTTLPAPTEPDQIGGHEGVGKIVALGEGAVGLNIGDTVGVKWVASICGSCEPCIVGVDSCCPDQTISGYFTPGTFQQYVIGPANYVSKVPEGLDPAVAAPLLCGGVTVYNALLSAKVRPGQTIAVLGAGGGLGHLAVQLGTKALGLKVIGIDLGVKEAFVKENGADAFIAIESGSQQEVAEKVLELTSDKTGVHAVLVCTPSNEAYALATHLLRFQGTLVCVGIPEHQPLPIANLFPGEMIKRDLRVIASATGNRGVLRELLDFANEGKVSCKVEVRKLDDLQKTFEEMEARKLNGRVVLDLWA